MRVALEPLTYAAGVDLFFYGENQSCLCLSPHPQQICLSTCYRIPYVRQDRECACHAGHVHAYERTTPVNNYTVDPCGTVHITIGVRRAIVPASKRSGRYCCTNLSPQTPWIF